MKIDFIKTTDLDRVYLIADTHFRHQNIIGFCGRPYLNRQHMDNVIFNNWRSKTRDALATYFLGDFGKLSTTLRNLLPKPIIFIDGNHDRGGYKALILDIDGFQVLLIHDPLDANGWDGWLIHGHKHQKCPHIDPIAKTVNVSVEAIGYKPITLGQILQEVKSYG